MSKQNDKTSLKMKLEAALLASGRPIYIEELSNILKVKPKEIKEALDSLKNIYSKDSALELVEFKDSYMLRIRPELAPVAKKFAGKPFLSRSMAKTLSLIAYYGPISIKELKEKRGSVVYSHIKALEKIRLIKKEETNGQKMYSVTDDFFKLFNVPQSKDELKKTLFNNLQQLEGKQ
ncbi:MAG: SMC-Scp complex subunit ScpB [Nitrososphaeria archaeon]|jgi:Predicted transcriptional regulator containing the HTH domain